VNNKRKWEIYSLMILAYLLLQVFRTGLTAIKTELDAEFLLTSVQYSNLSSAFFYSYAVAQVPAGILIDRFGARKVSSIGVLILGAGSFLCAVAKGYEPFFAARLLMGFGAGTIFLGTLKLQTAWFEPRRFGTITGVTTFLGNLGGALSQAPLVLLVAIIPWRQTFAYMAVGTLFLGVAIYCRVKDAPNQQGALEHTPRIPQRESLFRVIRTWRIYIPAGINLINQGIFFCVMTWGLPVLVDVYGLSAVQAGTITLFPPITAAITSLAVGWATDRFRSRKSVGLVCQVLLCIILIVPAFLLNNNEASTAVKLALGVTGLSTFYSIHFGTAKDLCPPECSAMAMSIVNLGTFAGASLFPIIFGKFVELESSIGLTQAYEQGFLFLLLSSVFAIVLGMLVPETYNKKNVI